MGFVLEAKAAPHPAFGHLFQPSRTALRRSSAREPMACKRASSPPRAWRRRTGRIEWGAASGPWRCWECQRFWVDARVPNLALRHPSSDLGVPSQALRRSSSELGVTSPTLHCPSSELGVPSPALRLPSSDLGVPSQALRLPSSVLGVTSPALPRPSSGLGISSSELHRSSSAPKRGQVRMALT